MLIATDNETHLIGPAQVAPKLVCVSIAYDSDRADVIHRRDPACYREVRWMLETPEITVGGHNLPYDLATWVAQWPEFLVPVFNLLDADRAVDSQVRQKLIDIAHGKYRGYQDYKLGKWVEYKYHLADLARRHSYPVDLDKDTWRLRYSELDEVDVKDWPEAAVDYSRHDALSTRWVIEAQEAEAEYLQDQFRQSRAHWALHLISAWGIRTDEVMVNRHRLRTAERIGRHQAMLLEMDLIYLDKHGVMHRRAKKIQEYAEEALGDRAKRTPTKKIKLDEDSVSGYGDPVLTAVQEYSSATTIMARVEELEQGVTMPIHTRFDELMETGRTSSSKPNIQARFAGNDPTEAGFGDRECFVPREGHVFLICDVPGLELRTIAQTCLFTVGHSRLAEILNAGGDPHLEVAARLLGISMEEAVVRVNDPEDSEIYLARQTGKVYNFGLNAGSGAAKVVEEARKKYGMILTIPQVKRDIEVWKDTLPEFRDFFKYIQSLTGNGGVATIYHYGSMRYRGYIPYTVCCNTFSQGLGADATKAALYAMAKACYVTDGPLLGSRQVNYGHDEYTVETLEENLDEKATQQALVICQAANEWLPDVPIPVEKMKPIATRRWSKLAKRVLKDGRLIPWEWDVAVQEGSLGYAKVG